MDSRYEVNVSEFHIVGGKRKAHPSYGESCLVKKDNIFYVAQLFTPATIEDNSDGTSPFHSEIYSLIELGPNKTTVGFYGFNEKGFKPNESIVLLECFNLSLEDLIRSNSPDFNNTNKFKIIFGTAYGMKCLHSKGICHRNLNISTVLLDQDFNPKISRFEFSKIFKEDNLEDQLTKTIGGLSMFNPVMNENLDSTIDPKAYDVLYFAFLVYHVLAGKKSLRNLHHILHDRRPSLCTVDENYHELINSCWSHDESLRPSFDDIIEKLTDKEMWLDGDESIIENYINFLMNGEDKQIPAQKVEDKKKQENDLITENQNNNQTQNRKKRRAKKPVVHVSKVADDD